MYSDAGRRAFRLLAEPRVIRDLEAIERGERPAALDAIQFLDKASASSFAENEALSAEELRLETISGYWNGLGLGLKLSNRTPHALEECRVTMAGMNRWSERHHTFVTYSSPFQPLTLLGKSVLEPETSESFELIAPGSKGQLQIFGLRNGQRATETRAEHGIWRLELVVSAGRPPSRRSRPEEAFLLFQPNTDVEFTHDPRGQSELVSNAENIRESSTRSSSTATPASRDVFICHASEDKEAVARPLATELRRTPYGSAFMAPKDRQRRCDAPREAKMTGFSQGLHS
jgi:hypothetical protein